MKHLLLLSILQISLGKKHHYHGVTNKKHQNSQIRFKAPIANQSQEEEEDYEPQSQVISKQENNNQKETQTKQVKKISLEDEQQDEDEKSNDQQLEKPAQDDENDAETNENATKQDDSELKVASKQEIQERKINAKQDEPEPEKKAKQDEPEPEKKAKQDIYVPPAGSDLPLEKVPRVLSPEEKYALEQNILRHSQKWETAVTPSGKTKYIPLHDGHTECNYHKMVEYQLCARVTDCDICQNIAVCGWCDHSNKCVPGSHQGPECDGDCLKGWIFNNPLQCTNKVKSGKMTNVEHLATELINPEIAVRKERKTIERIEAVKRSRPVIVGTMISDEFTGVNGFVTNKHQSKPIISDMEDEIPIRRTHETIISDIHTGQRLDKVWQERVQHGLERDLTPESKAQRRRRFKK